MQIHQDYVQGEPYHFRLPLFHVKYQYILIVENFFFVCVSNHDKSLSWSKKLLRIFLKYYLTNADPELMLPDWLYL